MRPETRRQGGAAIGGWRFVLATLAVAGLATFFGTAHGVVARAQSAAEPSPGFVLMGTIRGADGKPLGGITVSARAKDRTFTTSVFTDDDGLYVFPPTRGGTYRFWAQAVGFSTSHAEVTIDESRSLLHDVTLQSTIDITPQLSGVEWLDSLPADTAEDQRARQILRVACSDCHNLSVALQNRFDEAGWTAMVKTMEELGGRIDPPDEALGAFAKIIRFHRNDVAKYLAKYRGPTSPPLDFKLQPRPRGEAARAVVTEYDLPIGDTDEAVRHNGSDWSEGPGSGTHGSNGVHDVLVDATGTAWVASTGRTHRTITKVDVETGQTTAFKVLAADGVSARPAHSSGRDPAGNLWFDSGGIFIRLDPTTETFTPFFPPFGMGIVYNHVDSDSQGRIWGNGRYGAVRLDPVTNKWRMFQQRTPSDGFTYGVTADSKDNAWWSQWDADILVKADTTTGKVDEIFMHDPNYQARKGLATPADLEFYESIGGLTWGGNPANPLPFAAAPRRLAADKTGNVVWVPNWAGQNLAKVEIDTLKTTYYPLPINGNPYITQVDAQHNVWAAVPTGDRLVKLDPSTERWTVYPLPSMGCNPRHMSLDPLRGDAWMPCGVTSRVARFQFRTAQQIQAQRAGAQIAGQ